MTFHWANQRALPRTKLSLKTDFAASPRHMLVHRVTEASALWDDGKLVVQAEWACGDGATGAVLLSTPDEGGSRCVRCLNVDSGPAVYRCFDSDGALLYIGSSGCVAVRLATHRSSTPWWPDVDRVEVEAHDDVLSARRAEARAIATEQPRLNKVGTRQFHERSGAA